MCLTWFLRLSDKSQRKHLTLSVESGVVSKLVIFGVRAILNCSFSSFQIAYMDCLSIWNILAVPSSPTATATAKLRRTGKSNFISDCPGSASLGNQASSWRKDSCNWDIRWFQEGFWYCWSWKRNWENCIVMVFGGIRICSSDHNWLIGASLLFLLMEYIWISALWNVVYPKGQFWDCYFSYHIVMIYTELLGVMLWDYFQIIPLYCQVG